MAAGDRELEELLERIARRIAGEGARRGRGEGGGAEGPVVYEGVDARELLERVCREGLTAVVVFAGITCPACRAYRPYFYQYAARRRGRAVFAWVYVEHEPELAYKLGVTATPTTVVFKGCRPVEAWAGMVDDETLAEIVDRHLG